MLQVDTVGLFSVVPVKEKYYNDKPEITEHLKANIRDTIAEIQAHTLEKMHENCFNRRLIL